MKILITGGYGQLGLALKEVLAKETIFLTDTDNMDITEPTQIEQALSDFRPTHLIHGAAMTNVDGCEENPETAYKVNAEGTKNLADACKKYNCQMIYVSTDYVFSGTKKAPYTEEDAPNPQSVYGRTKLEGEKSVLDLTDAYIVRTSWVYGEGKNFVRTMLALSDKMTEIRVVNDQFGRPTAALDLAQAIFHFIINQPEAGLYNVTGSGPIISWADFASEIFKLAGKKTKVIGISTEEYLSQSPNKKIAPRPAHSSLDLSKAETARLPLPLWQDSLREELRKGKPKV